MSKTQIATAIGLVVVGTALVTAGNRMLFAEFGSAVVLLASTILFAALHSVKPELY